MRHLKPFLLPLALTLTQACGWIDDLRDRRDDDTGQVGPRCYKGNGIPVVDQGGASQRPNPPEPAPAPPASASANNQAPTSQQPAQGDQRAIVREYIRKLMDEPRVVPATSSTPAETRGGPGSFAQLAPAQVDEFVSAIIDGSKLFMPKSLKDEERWALVAAEISIESSFKPGTRGINPGDNSKVSVGPLQLTLPGMWDDIFRQYAKIPDLKHFDGSPWDITKTDNSALEHSIYDGVMAALWCITEQGRRGAPDWFGGPDGPCPKNMHTAFLAWVIGIQALKSGGDLASQRDKYLASISTDLQLLGFDPKLIETAF